MQYLDKKNNRLAIFGTLLLFIINYKFFYLFRLPGTFGQPSNEILYASMSIIIFFALLIFNNFKYYNFHFSGFIAILYLLLFIEMLFTLFKYSNEPIINSFRAIFPFFALLSYFAYSIFCQTNFRAFVKILILFSSVIGLFCIVELVLYTKYGVSLFHFFGFNYGLTNDQARSINYLRNGRLRLISSNLLELSSIISIGYLFSTCVSIHFRSLLVVNILISLIYTFWVSQTRSITFYIILVLIIVYLLSRKINRTILYVFFGVILTATIFLIYSFKNELNIIINSQYSLYHRLDEIEFYLGRFMISPIFGNGLIVGDKSLYNSQVVTGFDYIAPFSYNDVGIIGILGEFGLIGVTMIVVLLSKMISLFRQKKNFIILAIVMATVLSFINLSLLDVERLPVLAVYMATIDGAMQMNLGK